MMRRFVVPFINSRGQQHIVVVNLSEEEAADARRNAHVFLNVALAHAARHAVQHLPPGFTAFDLAPDEIRSVHLMSRPLDNFIDELRDDPQFAAVAEEIGDDLEGLAGNADERAIELSDSIDWIVRQRRSLHEKLQAIVTLIQWDTTAPPGTTVSMKKLTGW